MDWSWYTDSNVIRLYLHCILKANYKEKIWHQLKIPPGSFVTSYEKLAAELNLSVSQIRTSLKKLKITGNIAQKVYTRCSVITVKNYNEYQNDSTQTHTLIAPKSHRNRTQIATTNNIKKGRKEEYNLKEILENLRKEDNLSNEQNLRELYT
jgi:hypothetical protein